MGAMTALKRAEATGKRVIQTRWVDREKDGCVKSRLAPKDFNRDRLKTMLAVSSHDRNNHPERDTIEIAIDVHTRFLHADTDQELFAEPPEESEFCEDEVWKLHKALYGYRKAPKLRHQHVVSLLESLNNHPLSEMMSWTSIFSFMLMTVCCLARASKFYD